MIVEVQESTDLTYMLYDYNRTDRNGNKRELHISKALDVVNYKKSADIGKPMRALVYKQGYSLETLCECKYFCVEKITVKTEEFIKFANYHKRFTVLVCISGCGVLLSKQGNEINVMLAKKTAFLFLPS